MGNLVSHMAHVAAGRRDHRRGRRRTSSSTRPPATRSSPARRSRRCRRATDGTMDSDAVRAVVPRPCRPSRAPDRARHPREHPRPLGGPAARRRLHRARSAAIAHDHGVPLHVDGARLFNAVVALGTSAARRSLADADSATFCLSKGLACPVGSVVVGARTFIGERGAHARWSAAACARSGVLAAAGLVALRDGPDGHDRAPGRRPRQRSPARRRPRIGARRQPISIRRGCAPTSSLPRDRTGAAFLAGLEREGVLHGRPTPQRTDPRRDPLRHRGDRHRS